MQAVILHDDGEEDVQIEDEAEDYAKLKLPNPTIESIHCKTPSETEEAAAAAENNEQESPSSAISSLNITPAVQKIESEERRPRNFYDDDIISSAIAIASLRVAPFIRKSKRRGIEKQQKAQQQTDEGKQQRQHGKGDGDAAVPKRTRVSLFSCAMETPEEDTAQFAFEDNYAEMSAILRNKKERAFFKLYAAKEFSAENFLFLEAVDKFKLKCRGKSEIEKSIVGAAQLIFGNFLERSFFFVSAPSSQHQLNVSAALVKQAKEKIDGLTPGLTVEPQALESLFDFIVEDLKRGVLLDTFFRFKKSELYVEMTSARNRTKRSNSIT